MLSRSRAKGSVLGMVAACMVAATQDASETAVVFPLKVSADSRCLVDQKDRAHLLHTPGDNGTGENDWILLLESR